MYFSYKDLVLKCLDQKTYPLLCDHVIVYVEYKIIDPSDIDRYINMKRSTTNSSFSTQFAIKDNLYDAPEILYDRENEPFKLVYFSEGPKTNAYCVYKSNYNEHLLSQPTKNSKRILGIKLDRFVVDKFLNIQTKSFEEEIYTFITYLNFNVPKLRMLLGNLNFFTSTKFYPLSLKMCVEKYTSKTIPDCSITREEFGPSTPSCSRSGHVIDTRIVRGKISGASSTDILLSLNDDIWWQNQTSSIFNDSYNPYNIYYSTRWKTVVPLAFNPLENPII